MNIYCMWDRHELGVRQRLEDRLRRWIVPPLNSYLLRTLEHDFGNRVLVDVINC